MMLFDINKIKRIIICISLLFMLIVNIFPIILVRSATQSLTSALAGYQYSFYYGYQNKIFRSVHGYWYIFYSDSTNMLFKTSKNINDYWVSLSSTTVRVSNVGVKFSIVYDEINNKIHYVYLSEISGEAGKYRKGTPQSDGSISWDFIEQDCLTATVNVFYSYPTIDIDSNGYPYIGYRRQLSSTYQPYLTKSDSLIGWNTGLGYPLQLTSSSNSGWRTMIVSLKSNKMYVVYSSTSFSYGRLYDGSIWNIQVQISSYTKSNTDYISTRSYEDTVYHVFLSSSGIFGYKYNGVWSSEEIVSDTTSSISNPYLSVNSNGDYYIFWYNGQQIYYKIKYSNDILNNQLKYAYEASNNRQYMGTISSKIYDNIIVIGWLQGTTTWIPRFDYIHYIPISTPQINKPYVEFIKFNNTVEDRKTMIEAYLKDVEGLSGYILWHNSTNQPLGINTTWIPLSGTSSLINNTVTLPDYDLLIGFKFYINDTNNNWGYGSNTLFIVAQGGNASGFSILAFIFVPIILVIVVVISKRR